MEEDCLWHRCPEQARDLTRLKKRKHLQSAQLSPGRFSAQKKNPSDTPGLARTSVVDNLNAEDWRHFQNGDEGFVHRRQWEWRHAVTTRHFADVHGTVA